jgi:hypothetical protein
MAPAEPWKRLLSIATLGVARAAPATEELWPAGVTPIPAASVADTVLRAGMTAYLWQTAGGRAPAGPPLQVHRAPAPARAQVPEAACWRLARMLTGTYRELVPQWLALAQDAQRELPVHWLPTALAGLSEEERQGFPDVLGPAAAWLGELNPGWKTTPPAASEELWSSGTVQERLTQLTLLRSHDPDRARHWLEQSWPDETPEARTTLIPALYTRLGASDEAFLEQALDDRRKEVRTVAADCLSHLPQSAHARRNEQRLAALITGDRKRKLVLRIELPQDLDKDAQRDGLAVKRPQGMQMGERTWWLSQMLALTRPRYWTERFECDPSSFIHALERAEHGAELIPTLASAASLHPDVEWARALCRWLCTGKEDARSRAHQLARVLSALTGDQQPLLEELLERRSPLEHDLLDALLGAKLAWSALATSRMLLWLAQQVTSRQWLEWPALATFARRAHVASARQELAAILETLPEVSVRSQLEQAGQILDFRATMRRELLEDGH